MPRDLSTPAPHDGPRGFSAGALARAEAAAAALAGVVQAALAQELAALAELKPDLSRPEIQAEAWAAAKGRVHDIKGLGSAGGCPKVTEAAARLWAGRFAAGPEACDFPALLRELDDLSAVFREESGRR